VTDTATAPTLTPERRRELAAALDRVLTAQLRRVRRRFLLHGLGLALLLPVAAIALAFVLDHTLRLPAPIRLLHTLATAGLCGYALWRFVRYPLRKVLQPVDVALLLEGSFPQLGQRLVSAVQLQAALQQDQLRNQSLAMVEQLLHETAAHTQQLPYERLFDSRRTARIWAGTATVTLLLLAGVFTAPAVAWIFVLRHLGADVAYPKATRLLIELPPAGADLQRQDDGRTTLLTLPGGADLHVSVLAEGTMPAEAFLEVQNPAGENRSIGMTPRPGNRFRHVFRRVAGEFTFHARGGDDDDGDRLVHVRTINPPVVAQIRTRLRPPAYTGRPPSQQTGGAIEALVGTQVDLQVTATAAVSTAVLVFLESGKKLELRPTTVADDAGSVQGFGGAFVVEQSDRYQIDLVGDGGLRNPNPGTYPLAALQDFVRELSAHLVVEHGVGRGRHAVHAREQPAL